MIEPVILRAERALRVSGLPGTMDLSRISNRDLLYSTGFGARLGKQPLRVIGRIPAFLHLAKHAIGVVADLVRALGVLVVHPREDDHPGLRVLAEEQPVLLKESGAK